MKTALDTVVARVIFNFRSEFPKTNTHPLICFGNVSIFFFICKNKTKSLKIQNVYMCQWKVENCEKKLKANSCWFTHYTQCWYWVLVFAKCLKDVKPQKRKLIRMISENYTQNEYSSKKEKFDKIETHIE